MASNLMGNFFVFQHSRANYSRSLGPGLAETHTVRKEPIGAPSINTSQTQCPNQISNGQSVADREAQEARSQLTAARERLVESHGRSWRFED